MERSNSLAANMVHSHDGDFSSLELRAAAMMVRPKAGYKARKPGLLAQRIAAEKRTRLEATFKARPEVKRDIMVALYGGTPKTSTGALLVKQDMQMWVAAAASWHLNYTEHGDFSHLTGRGI